MGWFDLFPPQPECLCCNARIIYSQINWICDKCLNKMCFNEDNVNLPEINIGNKPSFLQKIQETNKDLNLIDRILSPLIYRGLARDLIRDLKYNKNYKAAVPLAEIMVKFWVHKSDDFSTDVLLLPIPLSRRRLESRGFNQAGAIARLIADKLSLQFCDKILLRCRETPPLYKLNSDERRDVLNGAFRVEKKLRSRLRNKVIVLIDDVVTTGSTLREAAGNLFAQGADKIIALTAAAVSKQDNVSFPRI